MTTIEEIYSLLGNILLEKALWISSYRINTTENSAERIKEYIR